MRFLIITAALTAAFATTACTTSSNTHSTDSQSVAVSDGHTAENSLDWAGSYQGMLPCADCSGIQTTLTLSENGQYRLVEEYKGQKGKPFVQEGHFTWLPDGSRIKLDEAGNKRLYFIGENEARALDADGNSVTGSLAPFYVLKKIGAQ